MDCPKCRQKTIAFGAWCRRSNAFRWVCPHCQALLKANRLVVVCFWLSVILALAAVLWILFFVDQDSGSNRFVQKALAVIVAASVVIPFVVVAWIRGGYKVMDQ